MRGPLRPADSLNLCHEAGLCGAAGAHSSIPLPAAMLSAQYGTQQEATTWETQATKPRLEPRH